MARDGGGDDGRRAELQGEEEGSAEETSSTRIATATRAAPGAPEAAPREAPAAAPAAAAHLLEGAKRSRQHAVDVQAHQVDLRNVAEIAELRADDGFLPPVGQRGARVGARGGRRRIVVAHPRVTVQRIVQLDPCCALVDVEADGFADADARSRSGRRRRCHCRHRRRGCCRRRAIGGGDGDLCALRPDLMYLFGINSRSLERDDFRNAPQRRERSTAGS